MKARDRRPKTFANMKEIITEHFHIFQGWNHLICKFYILMPNGEYILWEFLDNKLYKKYIWKI